MNQESGILNLESTHAWGLDLSGTATGAGGVGGLLLTALHSTLPAPTMATVLAPAYDGNGNILAYLDCATGQMAARYEYDPFGHLRAKDEAPAVAGRLHHQFSTKYTDSETSLVYYGYRYYSPEMGRWLSRDPIGEDGGIGLFGFVNNDPINHWDFLGMMCRLDSFKLTVQGWESSGPTFPYHRNLGVRFDVKVDCKEDCIIAQDKIGEIRAGSGYSDIANSWKPDYSPGVPGWWTGKGWTSGSVAPWFKDWHGCGAFWKDDCAVFGDAPGFRHIPSAADLPILFNRRYKTYVKDRASGVILKSIEWGVHISVSKGAGGSPVEKYWFSL